MLVRLLPSRSVNDRCTSRPCAITREPFSSDSATFSAASRQIVERRNSASPSTHSLRCLSKVRGVDAMVKFATATPDWVHLSSGSATRFPTMVITVSLATDVLPLGLDGSADMGPTDPADDHRDRPVCEAELLGQVLLPCSG